jgi:hypothetical protein
LGHSPNQLQNFFTVGNFDTSGPISLMIVNAVNSLMAGRHGADVDDRP